MSRLEWLAVALGAAFVVLPALVVAFVSIAKRTPPKP